MESDIQPLKKMLKKSCECGYNCSSPTVNGSCTRTWIRSVKRKLDELEVEREKFMILCPQVAHIEIENECGALREMVNNQQKSIRDLSVELEEERNAASSAANEAMSMILRLQREKAEIEMEARQFKRFSEQKTSHDQHEIAVLEDLLYKREQTIQSLTCEVQAYKYRMMSYGLTESEAEGEKYVITSSNSIAAHSENQFDFLPFEYPPLKCNSNEHEHEEHQHDQHEYVHEHHVYQESEKEAIDIDKYAFGETPRSLKDIEQRINQLEQPVLDKVIVGHSPRKPKLSTRFSLDSSGSFYATIKEERHDHMMNQNQTQQDYNKKVDSVSEYGSEMSDRIYTVDSIHYQKGNNMGTCNDDYMSVVKESTCHADVQDPEVMKLYARLHALEADRESMRQAIINMRTDKAQLVLLKEIAQNLCKDMSPAGRIPAYKRSVLGNLYVDSVFKWVTSIVLWRGRSRETKYIFGMSAKNAGMLVLLDKGPQVGQWRCLSRTQL
ncbi:myosin-binding protein 7 [Lactuca sativa]|uniref:GTD-binding domain-containing protein n=1 Tax=Lactuca sativa TaxID=4236 RepID=A0A9R1X477_LACSA|nr:myosin-binding protein 7 [Lactuca sativa]KAJ0200110.1 hypothetical protein LSAT_V11C600311690 [Lactuca sativa]